MVPRPIFTATHPRACSTAFERVFMTRRDILDSEHEPFGDAFYFGPEYMSDRFRDDQAYRDAAISSGKTYKDVLGSFKKAEDEGKRVFIKDMAYYFFEPDGKPTKIAASLGGGEEPGNPTNIPLDVLRKFNFTFLIRHPRRAIPSYWRCTIPPLDEITGFSHFMPNEAGYEELVRLFDFLIEAGIVDKDNIVVLDADDLLDNPEGIIRQYCDKVGVDFTPEMLQWNEDDRKHAEHHFEKWNGFHDDVIKSSHLRARSHAQKTTTVESENAEWEEKYGAEAQQIIRATVDANIPYYEHLRQYCLTA